jgi:putative redox protein
MQARVKWLDHLSFVGESGSGHSVVMDGSTEHGGRDLGVRPMEMVLLGLGGCSSIDIILMLMKARQDVTDCQVLIEAERADAVPAVFTRVKLKFVVEGRQLSAKQVERIVALSVEKYCSVTKMLEKEVEIGFETEIIELSSGQESS